MVHDIHFVDVRQSKNVKSTNAVLPSNSQKESRLVS